MTKLTRLLAGFLVLLLVVPVFGLFASTSPAAFLDLVRSPFALQATALSLATSFTATFLMVGLGTPLAWHLSRSRSPWADRTTALIQLPVVLPPAVLGVALLETFGRAGLFGGVLGVFGIGLPFTAAAVVLAQLLVGAPLYVLGATEALRRIDPDLLLVARSLGAPPHAVWRRVVLPLAAPGLVSAMALGWSRALGEFGATLLFAGNLPGRTQTLPLAIYEALERDIDEARALAVVLVLVALAVLLLTRRLHA